MKLGKVQKMNVAGNIIYDATYNIGTPSTPMGSLYASGVQSSIITTSGLFLPNTSYWLGLLKCKGGYGPYTGGVVDIATPGVDYIVAESDPIAMVYLDQLVKTSSSPSFANEILGTGAEQIANGGFTSDTLWTKGTGWSITGGQAYNNHASGTLSQPIVNMISPLVLGAKYLLKFTITFTEFGILNAYSGALVSIGGKTFRSSYSIKQTATYLFPFTCTNISLPLTFSQVDSESIEYYLDDVSLKRIDDGDLTTNRDIIASRYLKGANLSAMCKVAFGYGDGMGYYQIGSFTTTPFANMPDSLSHDPIGYYLYDPGNNYDPTTDYYVCPVSGVYTITIKARMADGSTEGASFGFGAYKENNDGPWFLWSQILAYRNGFLNVIIDHFNAGDQIRMFGYCDDGTQMVSDVSMVIQLNVAD